MSSCVLVKAYHKSNTHTYTHIQPAHICNLAFSCSLLDAIRITAYYLYIEKLIVFSHDSILHDPFHRARVNFYRLIWSKPECLPHRTVPYRAGLHSDKLNANDDNIIGSINITLYSHYILNEIPYCSDYRSIVIGHNGMIAKYGRMNTHCTNNNKPKIYEQ